MTKKQQDALLLVGAAGLGYLLYQQRGQIARQARNVGTDLGLYDPSDRNADLAERNREVGFGVRYEAPSFLTNIWNPLGSTDRNRVSRDLNTGIDSPTKAVDPATGKRYDFSSGLGW